MTVNRMGQNLLTSRREFLWRFGGGLGGVALAAMLGEEGLLANGAAQARPRKLQYPPKVRRVVQLYMSGAASQCDLWDYKPTLAKLHGQKFDPGEKVELFQSSPDKVMASPFRWRHRFRPSCTCLWQRHCLQHCSWAWQYRWLPDQLKIH